MTTKHNPYFVSVEDVRQIVAESGLSHARFCLDQMATQLGDTACVAQRKELSRLEQIEWEAISDSLAEDV